MNQSWKKGLLSRSDFFPIAVWLQSPENASRYAAAGINLYVALWQGPTEKQLATLRAAKMPVICEQNAVGLAHKDDPLIAGWMHGDEPDNAQAVTDPKTGKKGWGPCIPPEKIIADYQRLRQADPTRPILLNLGQGVANDAWLGRGAGAKLSDYKGYVQGGDIVSFDVYPVASGLPLSLVPKGIDRLCEWSGGRKTIWNCLECTYIEGTRKATPAQVHLQAWRSLIHGTRGLIYFVHEFKPKFNEHALLDDPEMLASVTATNRQIQALASVLNAPGASQGQSEGVEFRRVVYAGATYLFAAATGSAPALARFTNLSMGQRAEVLGEGRTLALRGGVLEDHFAPEAVHLYRLTTS